MMDKIYNRDVLRLAAQISATEPLLNPDATTSVRSPLCGSTIEVSLKVSGGHVTKFGQSIQACALGQASASIVAENVIGKNLKQILEGRKMVNTMLEGNGDAPEGDWSAFNALIPARDAKPRHGAILMPFDAVISCLEKVSAK